MSQDQHVWEHVNPNETGGMGFISVVHRMKVPGGWLYHTTLMKRRFLVMFTLHTSMAFVPEPQE